MTTRPSSPAISFTSSTAPRTRSMLGSTTTISISASSCGRRPALSGTCAEPEVVGVGAVRAAVHLEEQGETIRLGSAARTLRTTSSAARVTRITSFTRGRYRDRMAAAPKAPHDAHEWVSFEDPTEDRLARRRDFHVEPLVLHLRCGCRGSSPNRRPKRWRAAVRTERTSRRDGRRARPSGCRTLSGEQWQFRSRPGASLAC